MKTESNTYPRTVCRGKLVTYSSRADTMLHGVVLLAVVCTTPLWLTIAALKCAREVIRDA